jgi:alpha-ketoglutarate-dependent taurine dioxygenase
MNFINRIQKGHKTWVDVFETDDKSKVEKLCRENEFSFKWNQNEWLEISQVRPAVISHPETQEMVWFNQAHLFDFTPKLLGWCRYLAAQLIYCREHTRLHQVFFADQSKIPREDLYHILDVLDANTISFPWKKGDILVLDNVLAMHGRATFSGKRRILAAMTG